MLTAEEYEERITEIPTYDLDGKSFNTGAVLDEYNECVTFGLTHEKSVANAARLHNLSTDAVEAMIAVDEYERMEG